MVFRRIPIRHRQLVSEIENFTEWIAHLIAYNKQVRVENPKLQDCTNFFEENKTGLIIYAYDGDVIVRAEVGTRQIIDIIEDEQRKDLNNVEKK